MKIRDLTQFVDKTVTLRLTNGETAKIKIDFVDEESGEIAGALVETSDPDHRQACAMRTFKAEEILSADSK